MDLNEDCQLSIIEHLYTADLLSFAEAINTPLYAIEYVFKRLCERRTVYIEELHDQSCILLLDTATMIYIRGFPIISRFLRTFGHLISDLQIVMSLNDNHSGKNNIPAIFQLVNAHCSESLTTFSFYSSNIINISFEEFKTPFKQVKGVLLKGSFESLRSSNLSFKDIFPKMQILTINRFFKLIDQSSLETNFPHLVTLDARVWTENSNANGTFDADRYEKLIRNNPQIREIIITDATRSVLKSVADGLHHLEYLNIINYKEDENDNDPTAIHFEHLKTLIMNRENRVSSPVRLTFDQLEVFSTGTYSTFCTRWLDLVDTQKTLKVLKVERDLTLAEFAHLAENADLSLVEVQINCPSTNFNEGEFTPKMDHLVRMINNSQHLQKLILRIGYENIKSVLDSLQDRLSTKWNTITTEDEQFIYFERIM